MARRNFFHRVTRKTYASQRYRNPYFQKTKPKPWKQILIASAVLAGLIGLTAFFLGSSAFAYASVSVEGTQTINPAEIQSIADTYLAEPVFFVFRRSNRFLFRKDELEARLHAQFTFETLDVHGEGKGIHISVKEKTSQLLWRSGDTTYLVALDGVVIRALSAAEIEILNTPAAPAAAPQSPSDGGLISEQPAPPPAEPLPPPPPPDPLTLLPVFVDLNNADVTVGEAVMTPEEVANVFHFHELLRLQGIAFKETKMDREIGKWASIETEIGYAILFDPLGDIDRQAANLATVLHDSIPDPTVLDYVDLRFEDHIYYKKK